MVPAKRVGIGKDAHVQLHTGERAGEHIKPSHIPPKWTDVHVSTDSKSDVLVTARDAKGRTKTVYSESYATKTAAAKFSRVHEMIHKKEEIHTQNQAARKSPDHATREAADATYLIERQGTRPGSASDTGAKVKAYGATTLEARHVVTKGSETRLIFVGKEGVSHDHVIRDPGVAKMLVERRDSAKGPDGKLFDTNEKKLNAHIETLGGGRFTAKDFRTSLATQMAAREMSKMAPPTTAKQYKKQAMQVATTVSKRLGNKPAQALESYISPAVFHSWRID
jgi:DNA topoisomerase I